MLSLLKKFRFFRKIYVFCGGELHWWHVNILFSLLQFLHSSFILVVNSLSFEDLYKRNELRVFLHVFLCLGFGCCYLLLKKGGSLYLYLPLAAVLAIRLNVLPIYVLVLALLWYEPIMCSPHGGRHSLY